MTVAARRMIEIAKAVSYESDVPIMDEPTSALTETEVEHLFAIIRDLRKQGIDVGRHLVKVHAIAGTLAGLLIVAVVVVDVQRQKKRSKKS